MLSSIRSLSTLLAVALGAGTLVWLSAIYFRRKRREPSTGKSPSYNDRVLVRKRRTTTKTKDGSGTSRFSGGVAHDPENNKIRHRASTAPAHSQHQYQPAGSESIVAVADGRASDDSAVDFEIFDKENLVEVLLHRGVEDFESAIENWFEAIDILMAGRKSDDDDTQLRKEGESLKSELETTLQALISGSRKVRRVLEQEGLSHLDRFSSCSNVLTWIDEDNFMEEKLDDLGDVVEDMESSVESDTESFVSASESAQLEFDDLIDISLMSKSEDLKQFRDAVLKTAGSHRHLEFYVAGLEQYIRHGANCRKLRTSELGCESDPDFFAKVYCVREASEHAFSCSTSRQWFRDTGRYLLSSVIELSGKCPVEFEAAYNEMTDYASCSDNWPEIKDELHARGIKCMSFYDILLDFVLLDAFDDLDQPPSSVVMAIQNRWLSPSIKETILQTFLYCLTWYPQSFIHQALTTAIWGVLKAKSSYLENPYGFMAHFYVVSQYMLPVLTWGFLGPVDEGIKRICRYFKEQMLGYMQDLFNVDTADYTSKEGLSRSIFELARERSDVLVKCLEENLGTERESVTTKM